MVYSKSPKCGPGAACTTICYCQGPHRVEEGASGSREVWWVQEAADTSAEVVDRSAGEGEGRVILSGQRGQRAKNSPLSMRGVGIAQLQGWGELQTCIGIWKIRLTVF